MTRFEYTRVRTGYLWTTRWWTIRLYPPVWPTWTVWPRRRP